MAQVSLWKVIRKSSKWLVGIKPNGKSGIIDTSRQRVRLGVLAKGVSVVATPTDSRNWETIIFDLANSQFSLKVLLVMICMAENTKAPWHEALCPCKENIGHTYIVLAAKTVERVYLE